MCLPGAWRAAVYGSNCSVAREPPGTREYDALQLHSLHNPIHEDAKHGLQRHQLWLQEGSGWPRFPGYFTLPRISTRWAKLCPWHWFPRQHSGCEFWCRQNMKSSPGGTLTRNLTLDFFIFFLVSYFLSLLRLSTMNFGTLEYMYFDAVTVLSFQNGGCFSSLTISVKHKCAATFPIVISLIISFFSYPY